MTAPTQSDIRSWARSNGLTVNHRGSLPASVGDAYTAAHGGAATATEPASPAGPAASAPAGALDLAGALRTYLAEVDAEVLAVTGLSERIDGLVTELNRPATSRPSG